MFKKIIIILICLLLTGCNEIKVIEEISFGAGEAWLSGWDQRIEVTASNTNIDSDLTHFPLLLTLGTSVGTGSDDVSAVFDELTNDANRKKIAVTKSDGDTEIYVEIDYWNDAAETAYLWVSKSDLVVDADAPTILYLYYDIDHADNTTYVGDTNDVVAENVWDSNYVAIYHMSDGADTSNIYDSTSNDNDGGKQGANEPVSAAGTIPLSQNFDGANDDINVLNPATLDNIAVKTVEAIIDIDSFGENTVGRVFDKTTSTGGAGGWAIITQGNSADRLKFTQGWSTQTGGWFTDNSTILTAGGTYHVVVVYDRTSTTNDPTIYINGASVNVTEDANPPSGTVDDESAVDLVIGNYSQDTTRAYDGTIDEARISNIARNADWLKATYNSNIDNIVAWGSEETPPLVTDTCTPDNTGVWAIDLTDNCTTSEDFFSDFGVECYNSGKWAITEGTTVRVASSTACMPFVRGAFVIQE